MTELKDMPQETIDKFYEEAGNLLQDLWWCSRTWSGWEHKTMTKNDFIYAAEDEEILESVAEELYRQRQKKPL